MDMNEVSLPKPQSLQYPPCLYYGDNVLGRKIYREVHHKNKFFVLFVLGEAGVGKSSTAIFLAYALDRTPHSEPRFSLDQVCFTAKEFTQKINLYRRPKGRVIVWDEAATIESADARSALTYTNKIISSYFQTIRTFNQIIIVTFPHIDMIDKHVRFMSNAVLVIQDHDKKKAWGYVKFRYSKPELGWLNLVYPRDRSGDSIYDSFEIPMPPKDSPAYQLWKDYTRYQLKRKDLFARKWDLAESEDPLKTKGKAELLNKAFKYVVEHPEFFWNFSRDKPDLTALQSEEVPEIGLLPERIARMISSRWQKRIKLGLLKKPKLSGESRNE